MNKHRSRGAGAVRGCLGSAIAGQNSFRYFTGSPGIRRRCGPSLGWRQIKHAPLRHVAEMGDGFSAHTLIYNGDSS